MLDRRRRQRTMRCGAVVLSLLAWAMSLGITSASAQPKGSRAATSLGSIEDQKAVTEPATALLPWGGSDFIQYYVTARLLLQRSDPYDLPTASRMQRDLGRTGAALETYGPPPCLLPYLPLGLLPFREAVATNLVVSCLLLACCAWAWIAWLVGTREKFLMVCCLAAVPLWPPCLFVLGMGQNSILVLAGFTGCMACLRKGWVVAAGVCLSLAAVKPHLALALMLFALGWDASQRRLQLLAGLVLGLALAAVLVTWIRPPIWVEYVHFLARVAPPTQYHGATLDGWGRLYMGPWFRLISWPLWGLSVCAAGIVGGRTRSLDALPRRGALASCLALLGVPHAFSYDFVLLLPVFVTVVGGVLGEHRARWAWKALLMALAVGVLLVGKQWTWPEPAYWPVPWLAAAVAAAIPVPHASAALPAPVCVP